MTSLPRPVATAAPFLLWGGIALIAVLVLLDLLTFGHGPGDYYYAMVSILAAGAIAVLCLRASTEVRLILTILGVIYLVFLVGKVTFLQGPMVM